MPTDTDHLSLGMGLAKAKSTEQLHDALQTIVDVVGASLYTLLYFDTRAHGEASYEVHNIPEQSLGQWKDVELGVVDPVMQHVRLHSTPIAWGRDFYKSPKLRRKWESAADFGMRSGADVALHLSPSRHFAFGLSWKDADVAPSVAAERVRLVQTLAVFAEPSTRIIATLATAPAVTDVLTSRELECLYWASRGLTDKMIGSIIGVTDRTVNAHMATATRKLQAANRVQAVVRAQAAGLLDKPPVRSFD